MHARSYGWGKGWGNVCFHPILAGLYLRNYTEFVAVVGGGGGGGDRGRITLCARGTYYLSRVYWIIL